MNLYRCVDRGRIQFDFLLHVDERGAYDDEILSLGGRIFRVPGRRAGIYKNRRALNSFFRERTEYEIVHQHVSSLSYIEPLKIAARKNIPLRIIHSHNTMEGGSKLHKYLHLWHQKYLERYATDFFACSEPAALWLYGQERFERKSYKIVKNGINCEAFSYSIKNREKTRRELGIEGKTVIGHIGRFSTQKNHTFIIDVFNTIDDKDSVLLLVGDGDLRSVIMEKADRLGLGDRVIFAGVRSDICELYSAMDVLLFPSLHEGLSVVLVEAQAAGLACVVSENVLPEEVRLSDNILPLSLDRPPEDWASACLEAAKIDRGSGLVPRLEAFDINKVAEDLEKFYCCGLIRDCIFIA